jgi:hypothetical protein
MPTVNFQDPRLQVRSFLQRLGPNLHTAKRGGESSDLLRNDEPPLVECLLRGHLCHPLGDWRALAVPVGAVLEQLGGGHCGVIVQGASYELDTEWKFVFAEAAGDTQGR